jgi:4-hydroxy-3-methylbut-2-enyl diphosphate reductase
MNEEQLTPSEAVDETSAQATGVAPSPEEIPAVEVTSEPTADAPETTPAAASGKTDDEMLFEAAMASLSSEETGRETGVGSLTKGERIEAKVIQVENDRVFVDLGTKAEGVVPLKELTNDNVDSAIGLVKPGDTFEVIVLRTHSAEGNPVVSKKRADFDQQWQGILDRFESGEVFEANVIDRVKGGLVVDIGVRGFVPATHVGSGKLRNIEKYVGQVIGVKIIEVDRERKKVVLSNRAAEEERRDGIKDKLFEDAKPGDILEGVVRRLTDYGAFIDLGGIDGLLHISEMSWVRIDHPKEVLKEGDEIKVMVLRLDSGNGRISLGLRQVLPDPWNLIRENYKLGQKIKVTVGRMVQSGAFVRLPEGAEAFLPLSEVSDKRLKKPQDELEENQEIEPMIIDLRPDERRMVLSLRENAQPGGFRDFGAYNAANRGQGGPGGGRDGGRDGGGMKRRGPGGGGDRRRQGSQEFDQAPAQRTPTGGATIGERLGLLKGLMRPEDSGDKSE